MVFWSYSTKIQIPFLGVCRGIIEGDDFISCHTARRKEISRKASELSTVNTASWNHSFLFNLIYLFQLLGYDYHGRYNSRMRGKGFCCKFQNNNPHKTSPKWIMQKCIHCLSIALCCYYGPREWLMKNFLLEYHSDICCQAETGILRNAVNILKKAFLKMHSRVLLIFLNEEQKLMQKLFPRIHPKEYFCNTFINSPYAFKMHTCCIRLCIEVSFSWIICIIFT